MAATFAAGLMCVPGRLNADVVFAWNDALLNFSTNTRGIAPPNEARVCAMTHLAIHEAIESAVRQPLTGEARLAAERAAAVCAADGVLESVLPEGAREFRALAARHLGEIPDGPAKTSGMTAGRAAAERLLQQREKDGWSELARFSPPAGPVPEMSIQPPAAVVQGDDPPPSPWLQARPFALKTARQFPVTEARTLQHDGRVIADDRIVHSRLFDAVDRAAALETNERFWKQRPTVAWNQIAQQLAIARTLDLREQARLLAVLNAAIADATLSALHWRYTLGTWRSMSVDLWHSIGGEEPLSADVLAKVDNGLQEEFVRRETRRALIPPTPNYPSLTATVAGAAQAALAGVLKSDEVGFMLPAPDGTPIQPRVFARISTAAKECAFVASTDGRHCREACVSGYGLGAAVGGYAARRLAR